MHSPKSVHAHEALSSSPDWIVINGTKKSNVDEIITENGNDQLSHWRGGETSEEEYEDQAIRKSQTIVEDFTIEFFRPLQTTDQHAREDAADSIIELLRLSLATEKKELLKTHIATLVRLANETPFDDIQTRFQNFLKEIEDKSIPRPAAVTLPSNFIRKFLFPPVNTQDEAYRKIFTELFLQTGRVSHLHRVLAIHPSYLEKHTAAFNFIMNEPGPLPLEWRNYIAILASCRHKCKWLLQFQAQEFLLNGGQQKWLDGIDFVPKKLSNLLQVNQILSHQPWLLTKDHISTLVKGEDSWSIGELVHAILIICTFNALSGIVHGAGVTNEVDWGDFSSTGPLLSDSTEDEDKAPSNIDETKKLTELLKGGWEAREQPVEQQEIVFASADATPEQKPSKPKTEEGPFARFLANGHELYHEDFDVRAKHYSIFKVHEWNWKDDGFELARRFLPGAAALLDEEFDYIYNMTYNMLGSQNNKNIDTFPFRRAIWQYVQRIKGMFHDDYNYQEVNIFLNRSTKSYIKKISCYPETITKIDFQDIGYDLSPDEKVHVSLLAVESSKQSALLYGLHAVMKHMYGNT